jgi:anti-sigma factor RsiW
MSCPSYDWKAYALGELAPHDRREAETHAATCSSCREEIATFRLTLDALSTVRDEEVPRRIAFVSDKVFEPRWWRTLFHPSFAAACVIAAAILIHAFVRPAPAPAPAIDQATLQSRIDAAVAKAVVEQSDTEVIEKQLRLIYARNAGIVRQ